MLSRDRAAASAARVQVSVDVLELSVVLSELRDLIHHRLKSVRERVHGRVKLLDHLV